MKASENQGFLIFSGDTTKQYSSNNKKVFFSELTTSLNQARNEDDNIIVMGDLDIETQKNGANTNHYLSDLCDTFPLANLLSNSTCFK